MPDARKEQPVVAVEICNCPEAQALRAELLKLKAEHEYLMGMATEEDKRVMRLDLAKEYESSSEAAP